MIEQVNLFSQNKPSLQQFYTLFNKDLHNIVVNQKMLKSFVMSTLKKTLFKIVSQHDDHNFYLFSLSLKI